MPESARRLRAHDARRRVMPNGATGAQDNNRATARNPIVRSAAVTTQTVTAVRAVAPLRPCAPVALLGIMRSQAFSALWHLALSGIRRPFAPALLLPAPLLPGAVLAGAPPALRPYGVVMLPILTSSKSDAIRRPIVARLSSRHRGSGAPLM